MGEVYDIRDDMLQMPPDNDRVYYQTRPFVVMNAEGDDQAGWDVLSGGRLTSSRIPMRQASLMPLRGVANLVNTTVRCAHGR